MSLESQIIGELLKNLEEGIVQFRVLHTIPTLCIYASTLLVKFISIYSQAASGILSIASIAKVLMMSFSALSLLFGQTLSLSV